MAEHSKNESQTNGLSQTYPSYDEWLTQRSLPPETTPTPVAIQTVDTDYKSYANRSREQQMEDPLHNLYEQGRLNVYGIHWEGTQAHPKYGPSEWHHWYEDINMLGESAFQEFSRTSKFENILGKFGYLVGNNITRGDGPFDNQIWIVSKFEVQGVGEQQTAGLVDYACKIVHVRNYFRKMTLPQAGYQVLKEATVLLNTNHFAVIKVFDNIYIEDTESKFPYLFIASVMELMDGTVDDLVSRSPNWILPEEHYYWCLRDMASAVDYLHNRMRGPDGQRMRVVHMAIRAANILYRIYPGAMRNKFKLADFEECYVYDRQFKPELWDSSDPDSLPPDILPDPNIAPYGLPMSAPEVILAMKEGVDRTNLRVMPNDIWCLATTIALALVDDQSDGIVRVRRMKQMLEGVKNSRPPAPPKSLNHLLMIMTHPDPNQRATIREVLDHPYFHEALIF